MCTQCYYWSGRERNGAKEGGGDDEESSNSQRWQKSCPVPPFFVLNFMDFKAERGNWQPGGKIRCSITTATVNCDCSWRIQPRFIGVISFLSLASLSLSLMGIREQEGNGPIDQRATLKDKQQCGKI